MRTFGIDEEAEFQRLFTSTFPAAAGKQDLYDRYVLMAARLYSAAHPAGFAWSHDEATITTSVTEQYTVDATFNTSKPAEFDSFHDLRARVTSNGTWIPVRKIDYGMAEERGLITRTAMPSTVTVPTLFAMRRVGGATYLELFPYVIIDADLIDLLIPYLRVIPSIDGESNPDDSMLWDDADDDAIFTFATMLCARQRRDWNQFEASMRLGYMQTRERLAKLGIYEMGADFEKMMLALKRAETP